MKNVLFGIYITNEKLVDYYLDNIFKIKTGTCKPVYKFLATFGTSELIKYYLKSNKIDVRYEIIKVKDRINTGYGKIISSAYDIFVYIDTTKNLFLSDDVFISYHNTIKSNKIGIYAPLLTKPNSYWSNFWGALDKNGFYKRSPNYLEILNGEIKGVFKVPYINSILIMNRETAMKTLNFFIKPSNVNYNDSDMIFCFNCRQCGIDMFVYNKNIYNSYSGYLLTDGEIKDLVGESETNTNSKNTSNSNRSVNSFDCTIYDTDHPDWERKYLHSEFLNFYYNRISLREFYCEEPIPHLFEFPLFTELFCDEIIMIAEEKNEWSCGTTDKNKAQRVDKRINKVENHPTVDIHLDQLGYRNQWIKILKKYVQKVIAEVYPGAHTKGYNIAFVVKYDSKGQPSLRNHFDNSYYSMNIALNSKGVNFEGGGTYFVGQNYKHTTQKKGYCLIHPGKLTHYHAGLKTTKGIRYILVSFCN